MKILPLLSISAVLALIMLAREFHHEQWAQG